MMVEVYRAMGRVGIDRLSADGLYRGLCLAWRTDAGVMCCPFVRYLRIKFNWGARC